MFYRDQVFEYVTMQSYSVSRVSIGRRTIGGPFGLGPHFMNVSSIPQFLPRQPVLGVKRCVFLTDSFGSRLDERLDNTDIFGFPGATTCDLVTVIENCPEIFNGYDCATVLIGTNDVSFRKKQGAHNEETKWQEDIAFGILSVVRALWRCQEKMEVMIIGILPRPCDHEWSDPVLYRINTVMKGWAYSEATQGRPVVYCNPDEHFRVKGGHIKASLFEADGLHPTSQPLIAAPGQAKHIGHRVSGGHLLVWLYIKYTGKVERPIWLGLPANLDQLWDTIPELREFYHEAVLRGPEPQSPYFKQEEVLGYAWYPENQAQAWFIDSPDCVDIHGADQPASNFYQESLWYFGIQFSCVEAAYQMGKAIYCGRPSLALLMFHARNAYRIKALAGLIPQGWVANWNEKIRLTFILQLMEAKWLQSVAFREQLKNTGQKCIVHVVNNYYWGIQKAGNIYVGKNTFGSILMLLRDHHIPMGPFVQHYNHWYATTCPKKRLAEIQKWQGNAMTDDEYYTYCVQRDLWGIDPTE